MPTSRRRFIRSSLGAAVALAAASALASPSFAGGPYDTFTVPPCRIVDTRNVGGAISGNGSRHFLVAGTFESQGGSTDCGVPFVAAKGVFINIVAASPSGHGHLTVYPYPLPLPLASTLNFSPGQNIANGVMVPICDPDVSDCEFDFTVTMGPAATHVVIDVTGYLQPTP
jgi:hypothetical protein